MWMFQEMVDSRWQYPAVNDCLQYNEVNTIGWEQQAKMQDRDKQEMRWIGIMSSSSKHQHRPAGKHDGNGQPENFFHDMGHG